MCPRDGTILNFLSVRTSSYNPYESEMCAGQAALLATFLASSKISQGLLEASDINNSNGFTENCSTPTCVLKGSVRRQKGDYL